MYYLLEMFLSKNLGHKDFPLFVDSQKGFFGPNIILTWTFQQFLLLQNHSSTNIQTPGLYKTKSFKWSKKPFNDRSWKW